MNSQTDVHFPKKEITNSFIQKAEDTPIYGMAKQELQELRNWDFKKLANHLKKEV